MATALVEAESPSTDRAALDACAAVLVSHLRETGADVERSPAGPDAAAHVIARWPGRGPRLLLLGHFDTVWPVGQLARMPLREDDGRLYGPGVLDMKTGLAIGALAMRTLMRFISEDTRPCVTLVATADEETGSRTSRDLIERMAREHAAVLVLEPALPGGAVKTARKGVGEFEILAEGIPAHAGVDPAAGASAIHALARAILDVEAIAALAPGTTVNVGVVSGGSRPNVVAERATARVDVRVGRLADAPRVEAAFRELRAHDPRVRLTVTGGVSRPPMERTEGVARLYELARATARELGFDLAEGATGGGSDGNFTAAIGVPTLDGLGATGVGPHALHEHVEVAELPRRAALVAGILARAGRMG